MAEESAARAARVMVGVSGGVAAYKAAELVRTLQRRGCEVRVTMTRAAQEFVRPLTFSSLTGHRVLTTLWGEGDASGTEPAGDATGLDDAGSIEHIAEAQWADVVVIAPATAHVLAKMAHGLADDFLSTMLLATTAPVVVAPAMNVNMWNHAATRANVAVLRDRGVRFVDPDAGYLACGMVGSGRLAEIDAIADAVLSAARPDTKLDLAGEVVLVTAGGTREAIDPVRFLGNRSSGRMGYAIAEAARQRGAEVVLVSAPTALVAPAGCVLVPVTTAEEMRTAVMEQLPRATVVIGAAAVADFRASSVAEGKIRREGGLTLELEPTADILRAVSESRRPETLVVAFAAEMDEDIERARAKMRAKGADAVVLNDVSRAGVGFDSERNAGVFVTADEAVELGEMPKREMADRILDLMCRLRTRVSARI
ncbi:MAG TPA: bifunctional phosphopantothenoylcysteine decarboxylase/phosphopantothenate--cysteine ligase CoaBC [Acidobacteriaceae bacterium]|nr:bifunctional phosphopantothenoylcysteine decarboxylase/phosphopantothenate--cysteine ligase CoaBC [Acidobacteriaceae bacterium]